MKKSMKLLCALLTAVLLVGIIGVSVFADDEPGRVAYSAPRTNWSVSYNANEVVEQPSVPGIQISMTKTYGHLDSGKNGDNTYLKFWNEKDDTYVDGSGVASTTNPWLGLQAGSYGSASNPWRLSEYDYVVVDFEFCSDQYMDPETREFVEPGTEGAILAYPENATFTAYVRAHPNANNYFATQSRVAVKTTITLDPDTHEWYISPYTGGTKVKLAQEAGVWNHFSLVIAVDRTPIYTGKTLSGWKFSQTDAHLYLEGQHFASIENFVKTDVDTGATVTEGDKTTSLFAFEQIRVEMPNVRNTQSFSLCFDNIDTSYYEAGYSGGLDKVIADKNMSLASADDTLLSGQYQRPYPMQPVATLDEVSYFYQEATYNYIKNDSGLEIFESFNTPCYVDSSFIVKSNGYDFPYTTDAYELQKVGDDLYFVRSTDPVRIIFDGDPHSNYKGALYDDSLLLAAGAKPQYPGEIPPELEYSYHSEDGKIWEFIGWSTEKGASEASENIVLTQEDVYYGCYYVYPVYAKLDPAYFVETKNGDDTVRVGYHTYETLADSLKLEGVKIIFNGAFESSTVYSIENNVTVDTNGYVFLYSSKTKIAGLENGVYTFRDVKDEEKLTINWYAVGDDELKSPIATEIQIPGNTFNYKAYDSKIVKEAYSALEEKVARYTGWSIVQNNGGEALTADLYTISLDTTSLNFYPMYDKLDCAYYVEINGVKTGYISYETIEDHTTIAGAKIFFATPYTELLYIEDNVTLVPGENNLIYYSDTKAADVVDGCYVFRAVKDTDYADVFWVDLTGKTVAKEKSIIGNTIYTPKLTVKDPGNLSEADSTLFYKLYLAWEDSYTVLPLEFDGTNPNRYKPTSKDEGKAVIEIDIQNIKYGFSALSDFRLNVYLPDPKNDAIKILEGGTSSVIIDGVDYVLIPDVATLSPAKTDEIIVTVNFSLNGKNEKWDVSVSLPEYFKAVLAKDGVTEAEKNLIYAAVNYCNEIYKLENNGVGYADYAEILKTDESFLPSLDNLVADDADDATNGLTAKIKTYVDSIRMYYDASAKGLGIAFVITEDIIYDLGLNPESYSAEGKGLYEGTYGIIAQVNGLDYGTTLVETDDGEYLLVVDFDGEAIPAFAQNSFKFTIWQYKEGASKPAKPSGCSNKAYSLSLVIEAMDENGEDTTMLKSIFALSYAAKQYNATSDDMPFVSEK